VWKDDDPSASFPFAIFGISLGHSTCCLVKGQDLNDTRNKNYV